MHKNNILQQGGEYIIERSITSGGLGCTYEAHHTLSQKYDLWQVVKISKNCMNSTRQKEFPMGKRPKVVLGNP